jgi:hypothetical protein
MTKKELLRWLDPFPDDCEMFISVSCSDYKHVKLGNAFVIRSANKIILESINSPKTDNNENSRRSG